MPKILLITIFLAIAGITHGQSVKCIKGPTTGVPFLEVHSAPMSVVIDSLASCHGLKALFLYKPMGSYSGRLTLKPPIDRLLAQLVRSYNDFNFYHRADTLFITKPN